MKPWERFAYVVMRSYWPVVVIVALAAFAQGWMAAGVLFSAMAFVMFWFGRRSRDQEWR